MRSVFVTIAATPYRTSYTTSPKAERSVVVGTLAIIALALFGPDECSRWRWYRRLVGGRWAKTDYVFSPRDNIFLTVPHCCCKSSCECEIYD